MTKLDAVNIVLTSNGQRPMSELHTGSTSIVSEAERTLDQVELEIQTKGWHYNTLRKVTLTPDVDNHIVIPAGVITIDTDDTDASKDVTQQGDHLYNLDDNTDEFTDPLSVTYVQRLEFSCIPEPFKQWIAAEAAHVLGKNYHPEQWARNNNLAASAALRKAEAQRFNGDKSNANVLNNVDAVRFRGRNRNRRGGMAF